MKIPELKQELKKYNIEEKDKIIVELYKRLPKSVKVDYRDSIKEKYQEIKSKMVNTNVL